jgi:hypothetical protein
MDHGMSAFTESIVEDAAPVWMESTPGTLEQAAKHSPRTGPAEQRLESPSR